MQKKQNKKKRLMASFHLGVAVNAELINRPAVAWLLINMPCVCVWGGTTIQYSSFYYESYKSGPICS